MELKETDLQYLVKDEANDEAVNDVIVDDYDDLNGFYMQVPKRCMVLFNCIIYIFLSSIVILSVSTHPLREKDTGIVQK